MCNRPHITLRACWNSVLSHSTTQVSFRVWRHTTLNIPELSPLDPLKMKNTHLLTKYTQALSLVAWHRSVAAIYLVSCEPSQLPYINYITRCIGWSKRKHCFLCRQLFFGNQILLPVSLITKKCMLDWIWNTSSCDMSYR